MSMIINPYAFAAGGGPVEGVVSFVSATGTSYIASGTSISAPSSPAAIEDGDGLFAVLFARSALTPPAGWTLVASQAVNGGTAQSTYIYRKNTVTAADSSTAFAWTQSAAGRMGLAYITCRSTSGAMSVAQTAGIATTRSASTSGSAVSPILTADGDGQLCLLAVSDVYAGTAGSSPTWTSPSGSSLRTTATQVDNRLAAATHALNSGNSTASPWTFAHTSSQDEFAALVARIVPA